MYVVWRDIRAQVEFIGELTAALWFAVRHPASVRWKDVWRICERVGVDALPIVALISFLLGMILAFQSAVPMKRFGAEIFVADLIGLAMLRELGPLMTAILLAGRSGAAFAAEIGTMRVNQEVDALTTMGLEPGALPRDAAHHRGDADDAAAHAVLRPRRPARRRADDAVVLDSRTCTFLKEVDTAVNLTDFLAGFVKSFVFALLVAGDRLPARTADERRRIRRRRLGDARRRLRDHPARRRRRRLRRRLLPAEHMTQEPDDVIIRVEGVDRRLRRRRDPGEPQLRDPPRRGVRHPRRLGLRQEHADEAHDRAQPADRRPRLHRWRRHRDRGRGDARAHPAPLRRDVPVGRAVRLDDPARERAAAARGVHRPCPTTRST